MSMAGERLWGLSLESSMKVPRRQKVFHMKKKRKKEREGALMHLSRSLYILLRDFVFDSH